LNPSLTVWCFFSARHLSGERPEQPLVEALGLTPEEDGAETRRYRGRREEGNVHLSASLRHDTLLVRLALDLEGEQPASAWARLRRVWEKASARPGGEGAAPWALTCLYHALLPRGVMPAADPQRFADLPFALPSEGLNALEATPYGWFACLGQPARGDGAGEGCHERTLLLLTPQERAEKVRHYFLDPLTQGLARIELHLQKALYHAGQQPLASQALAQATLRLRQSMTQAVSTLDFAHLYREFRELEEVSSLLMTFLNQKAHAEMLLHSLRINLQDLAEALDEVQFHPPSYEGKQKHLARQAEQLQSDLRYAEVVLQSAYAFQEMQRGIENNRLQRASLMLGTAAALLAGITIFNSFLDIWALILEGSGWLLPPMWARMAIGLLAGVSLPLAAYWAIERRRMMIAWSVLGGLSFVLAILSTLWVNRS
jgi:hypothetical protein